jgi:hypothetical protein
VIQGRDVALTGAPAATVRSSEADRASNPYAGGGF